jgi:hypothetical protein
MVLVRGKAEEPSSLMMIVMINAVTRPQTSSSGMWVAKEGRRLHGMGPVNLI